MENKECPVCSKNFETKYKSKVYCSQNCKNRRYLKICTICNNEFRTSHKEAESCSKKCASVIAKRKLRKEKCFTCNKTFSRPSLTFANNKERYFCSDRCANYTYSKENPTRYGGTYRRRRKEIMKRDNYMCTNCNSKENLEVHHIIPIIKFNDPNEAHYDENVITVCKKCHYELEKNNKT